MDRSQQMNRGGEPDREQGRQQDLDRSEIERRAYERYEARGRGDGQDQDDWFAAEQDVRGGGRNEDIGRADEAAVTGAEAARGRATAGSPLESATARGNRQMEGGRPGR